MSRAAPDFSSALRFIHDPGSGSLAPISVPAGCVSPSTGLNMTASGALFGRLDAVDFQSFRYGR